MTRDETKTLHGNTYDWTDTVHREAVLKAGPLKLACYRVRDPETGEYGDRQFHMTYDNMVMAVMSESAAKLFARFVADNAPEKPVNGNPCGEIPLPSAPAMSPFARARDVVMQTIDVLRCPTTPGPWPQSHWDGLADVRWIFADALFEHISLAMQAISRHDGTDFFIDVTAEADLSSFPTSIIPPSVIRREFVRTVLMRARTQYREQQA